MKILAALVGLAVVAACSGQTSSKGGDGGSSSGSSGSSGGGSGGSSSGGSSGSSSGASGSSSGTGFGCPGDFTTTPSTVDPNVCSAQLSSTTSCMGQPCSWTVEVPCAGDAGANDGGATDPCNACNSAAPPDAGPPGLCQPTLIDGGPAVMIQCGGCGI